MINQHINEISFPYIKTNLCIYKLFCVIKVMIKNDFDVTKLII